MDRANFINIILMIYTINIYGDIANMFKISFQLKNYFHTLQINFQIDYSLL